MTTAYAYDGANRLKTVATGGTLAATYTYDGDGYRTKKLVGTATSTYARDRLGAGGLGTVVGDGQAEYGFGPAGLQQRTVGAASQYAQGDGLGSAWINGVAKGVAVIHRHAPFICLYLERYAQFSACRSNSPSMSVRRTLGEGLLVRVATAADLVLRRFRLLRHPLAKVAAFLGVELAQDTDIGVEVEILDAQGGVIVGLGSAADLRARANTRC